MSFEGIFNKFCRKSINECDTLGQIRKLQKEREYLSKKLNSDKYDFTNQKYLKMFQLVRSYYGDFYFNSVHELNLVHVERALTNMTYNEPDNMKKMFQDIADSIAEEQQAVEESHIMKARISEIDKEVQEKKLYLGIK